MRFEELRQMNEPLVEQLCNELNEEKWLLPVVVEESKKREKEKKRIEGYNNILATK